MVSRSSACAMVASSTSWVMIVAIATIHVDTEPILQQIGDQDEFGQTARRPVLTATRRSASGLLVPKSAGRRTSGLAGL